MNILLLDDDDIIVETVKTMIDWEKIGIDEIYTANDPEQARQILGMVPIDIMLCDIEMGYESGLEFVEKRREEGDASKVIFLTSYAEFSYAQKAIGLNSVEYLLKPVKFQKLEDILSKTVKSIHQELISEKMKNDWLLSRSIRCESFWKIVLKEKDYLKNYRSEIELLGMAYEEMQEYIYLQVTIFDYQLINEKAERGMIDFNIKNMAEKLFSCDKYSVETIFRVDGEDMSWWSVVLLTLAGADYRSELKSRGQGFLEEFKEKFGSKVRLYIAKPCKIGEMYDNCQNIRQMADDDVYTTWEPQFLEDYKYLENYYIEPSFSKWEDLLLQGNDGEVLKEINAYLEVLRKSGSCSSKMLRNFQMDFSQMLCVVLRKRGLNISKFMGDEKREEKSILHSISSMKDYVKKEVERVVSIFDLTKKSTVVEEVLEYIDSHLGEELTREDFAAQFFLNGDYLARLFKKETGASIGAYLQMKRLQKAKELLRETNLSVSQIASEVGYYNFSYFAKIFRKAEGITPNEWRRNV